jgi:glutamine synthetase
MGDREAGAAAGELAAELEKMRADGVETVHVGIFDLNGTFRERRLALDDVAEVFGPGGTFVNVLPQWDAGERLFGAGPFVGEAVALDPATVRPYPFEPGACLLVADYAGPSAALSPRELLRNQIAKAEAKGFGVRAAFEFEFFVLEEDAASLRQSGFSQLETFAKDNRCWAGESAATHAGLVAELQEALAAGGLDLLALGLELGPGCFEATLRQTTPLRAADDAAFFKLFTKAFCRQQDLTASFMAQLGADFPGLSGHLHLSLFDRESGANLFADTGDEYGMSALFRHFVAGLVGLAPEAMPFSHHTVNYAAAVRVVAAPEERCRLEYRLPGADTNPFMTLAFALGAGLWGLENELPLPPEFGGGGPNDMPADGTSLPHDLFEATERLTGSERAREIWGTSFVDHLIAACRAEEAGLRRETSAAERARYLEVV